ncbi:S1C family serine protease [Bradyrhizobium cenepequi]|uniref:S1C family serine protease n=1 Tax=Bradyrhizobium cenepequi TaxID=2821403 RepID=UPI001CE2FC8C|nr:trypsin-like peptidase domain-containing protein [Bradyrhizobium cenepequi]MCA6111711.1 trypsin-like peptidase domain-containing protein [Bradyrhizobium cenepequi]
MEYRNSSFSYRRASALGGIITSAILVSPNAAHSQAVAASSAGTPPASMHRVADAGHNGKLSNFADLAEKIGPAVIGVTSRGTATQRALPNQPFGFGAPDRGHPKKAPGPHSSDPGKAPNTIETIAIGSGFFISADGYAVTNSHVVEDTDTAQIRTSDEKTYPARVVGKDSLSDLALIKVDGRTDFSYVRLADQSPRVGDWVLTAGNPFGLRGTVTAGIVSARERELGTGSSEGFIQIDAPINNGDSGGPSFNTNGDVIGVNSMIFSPSGGWAGVAFAIPVDTVKSVIPQLKDKGAVTRGSIGAEVQSVTPEIAESLGANNLRGAIVARVQDNSPAAKAGLKGGDVITSAGGEPVKNANELTKKIHAMAPGSSIQLATVRHGKENSLNVTLGQLPDQPKSSRDNPG